MLNILFCIAGFIILIILMVNSKRKNDFTTSNLDKAREQIFQCTYNGDDVNINDFYDRNYRNNNDEIISICNNAINFINEHQIELDKQQIKSELDFFYFRLGEAYEFQEKYELAMETYKKSLNLDYDEETQERFNICSEKLKGKNDSI